MKHLRTGSAVAISLVTMAAGTVMPSSVAPLAARAETTRTVYFSARDGSGAPVRDLAAGDLSVKEGGTDRAIATLKPATAPMSIAIIVDDQGSGGYQAGVSAFVEKTFGDGTQFSFRVMSPQAIRIQDFTDNVENLRSAVGRIGQRGRIQADGEQIIAGVSEAAKDLLKRKAERPIIVVFAASGETALSELAKPSLDSLRDSGASLWVVHIARLTMGAVLGDGPKQSGGAHVVVGSGGAIAALIEPITALLKSQYVLTYTLPDGTRPNERFTLATNRRDVTLLAPTRIPNR